MWSTCTCNYVMYAHVQLKFKYGEKCNIASCLPDIPTSLIYLYIHIPMLSNKWKSYFACYIYIYISIIQRNLLISISIIHVSWAHLYIYLTSLWGHLSQIFWFVSKIWLNRIIYSVYEGYMWPGVLKATKGKENVRGGYNYLRTIMLLFSDSSPYNLCIWE